MLPSPEEVNDKLNQLLNKVKGMAGQRMNYWDMVAIANVKLCLAILNSSTKTSTEWYEVLELFRRTWAKAGSKGKRLAEIEHLQLLDDELSLVNKHNVNALRKNIRQLRDELVKMV